jgi:hypothetical protein
LDILKFSSEIKVLCPELLIYENNKFISTFNFKTHATKIGLNSLSLAANTISRAKCEYDDCSLVGCDVMQCSVRVSAFQGNKATQRQILKTWFLP